MGAILPPPQILVDPLTLSHPGVGRLCLSYYYMALPPPPGFSGLPMALIEQQNRELRAHVQLKAKMTSADTQSATSIS